MPVSLLLIITIVALGGLAWVWATTLKRSGESPDLDRILKIALLAGLLCRAAYVFLVPPGWAPDEQAHFNYIRYLAEHHTLPVQTHKWPDPAFDWENYQPPLYYVLALPVYASLQGIFNYSWLTFHALRLGSVLLWLVNLWFARETLRRLEIKDVQIRNFVLAMVCVLPTYTFLSAAINNDNLLTTMGGALIYLMASRQHTWKGSLLLGFVLGLALLTKQSAAVFAPAIVILFLTEVITRQLKWPVALQHLCLVGGMSGLMFGPLMVRNVRLYHSLAPENLFVDPRQWPNLSYGLFSAVHNLVRTFWSAAGAANDISYPFPLVGMAFLVLCVLWRDRSADRSWAERYRSEMAEGPEGGQPGSMAPPPPPAPDYLGRGRNRPFLLASFTATLIAIVLVLNYGYKLGMGQGRHLFPFLFPIALLLAPRWRRLPVKRLEPVTTAAWISYAVTFCVFVLWRFYRLSAP